MGHRHQQGRGERQQRKHGDGQWWQGLAQGENTPGHQSSHQVGQDEVQSLLEERQKHLQPGHGEQERLDTRIKNWDVQKKRKFWWQILSCQNVPGDQVQPKSVRHGAPKVRRREEAAGEQEPGSAGREPSSRGDRDGRQPRHRREEQDGQQEEQEHGEEAENALGHRQQQTEDEKLEPSRVESGSAEIFDEKHGED